MALLSKHREVESELAAAQERLQQQASDLVLKASKSTHSSVWCSAKTRSLLLFQTISEQSASNLIFTIPSNVLQWFILFLF